MYSPCKKNKSLILIFVLVLFVFKPLIADESELTSLEMSFKNFIQCELTRTDAINHFNDTSFKITMIDLFDVQYESGLKIITGAVKCFVVDKHQTLYVAVGLKRIMEIEQLVYYTIQKKNFTILATELMRYPYKERCKWSQYWVDID